LSILAAVAAVIAPLRHPLLAEAQAATVDQLSGGRLILGLGSGAPLPESRREFNAVGVPFAGRLARQDNLNDDRAAADAELDEYLPGEYAPDTLAERLPPALRKIGEP
jgi:alkanesulfonate monooxygenase SsuD/methylene tetrahydromethanopterin reductase-like flavin-dependent oxidoreductase (luciferase family)